ncbi:hypothetical protein RRU01S_35_00150 [Agrobacterium rubi TR3 = NBRC 13261]|uniref:Uncharacterized protein n=1 Tax=Agrobacterium rubi TR3 = NBRC 13261 TaxID=1368415 RepID=A0A081D310_9HYPH|nr:hypothetical protein [Agrobacterium rubi]MBP1881658.1 hypothetical protein [Agrobacterium rubi]GAK73306.1 hypothetical protein RRU01S_35_00150 [Agrobacterium rubi TR3 = NBRC 13261]
MAADQEARQEILERMAIGARIDTKDVALIKKRLADEKLTPAEAMTAANRKAVAAAERWLNEGPIRLATNATITAMDNAGLPKDEQAAIVEDRDIIMKHNMRLGVISEVFAPAIEKTVNSSRPGSNAQDEIARLIVTAISIRQEDDSELVTFTFTSEAEANAFDKAI